LLERNRFRKQDVVFQMNVLMQILFERFQCLIEGLVTDASVSRRFIIGTQLSQLAENFSGMVVLEHHHADGIVDRSKRGERRGTLLRNRLFEFDDEWKQDLFLLKHVAFQFSKQLLLQVANAQQL